MTPTAILAALGGLVGAKGKLGWLAGVGLLLCALVALWGAYSLWLHFHDRAVVSASRDHDNAKALDKARQADGVSSLERRADEAVLNNRSMERINDIQKSDDPERALACRQLRQAGKDRAADASGCGR